MSMKIYSIKKIARSAGVLATSLMILSIAHGQTSQNVVLKTNTNVKVYTTAQNTTLKLSPVDDIQFSDVGNMVERKVFIFLDDSRSFQRLWNDIYYHDSLYVILYFIPWIVIV